MRKLLNTLYIMTETAYLALDGETVDVLFEDGTHKNVPLHTIESIVCFSYKGASPALMGKCAKENIGLTFFSPQGKYLATVTSGTNGNVLLRKNQFRYADDEKISLDISKNFITGKIYNSKYVLLRCLRDHPLQVDKEKMQKVVSNINRYLLDVQNADTIDTLRGIEGNAAAEYFSVFNELILNDKEEFAFYGRVKRPPTNRINALLSFTYVMLSNDCASALYSVGLDPYVGFMHSDRPGRKSLSLDLVEELRSVYADRFVLTLINNRIIKDNDFDIQETGVVKLKDEARKKFLNEWQTKKKQMIQHPYLKEKIPWGLVPYVQAMLLARCVRGDIDGYPPFFWK